MAIAQVLTGLYDDHDDALAAVRDLEAAGIPHDNISMVASNIDNRYPGATRDDRVTDTENNAGTGAGIGGVLVGGVGLLTGLGLLAIPGVGPVVAAGWLAATAAGAGVGALSGGLLGSLTGHGVNPDHAQVYAEGVRRGGTLLTVKVDQVSLELADRAMRAHNMIDPEHRARAYREHGWNGFDENAPAYTAADVERDRSRYR